MRTVLAILVGTLLLSCTANQPDLSYTISPSEVEGKHQLQVTMTFTPEADGETYITHLNEAWGESDLYDCLVAIEVLSEHSQMRINADSNRIEVEHPTSLNALTIQYTIQPDYEGALESARTYRPVVQPEYFHLFSHLLFMVPEELEDTEEPADIQLSWQGFEEDFVIHNSFGSNEREQRLRIAPVDFWSGIFVGGDFRVHPIEIQENKVYLALRGEWIAFTDEQVVQMLEHTIQSQRDFWRDHSQDYFTVTLIPTVLESGSSMGGTGLTNSFAANASNNDHLDFTGLSWLFNHELMHNWIGHTIKNADEEQQYWFSEGFTEYNNFKNISSNEIGGFTQADYYNELNKYITLLMTSPVVDAPNSEINYANFWSDRSYEKLPYYRGAVLAFYLDHLIRLDSDGQQSLDDLLRQILTETQLTGQKVDHDYFLEVVNGYVKDDFTPFFDKHIVQGVPYDLETMFEHLGMAYTVEDSRVFESGFVRDADYLVTKVVSGSQAEQAGLRQGDKIKVIDMYSDPEIEAHMTIVREGQDLQLDFFPYRLANIPTLVSSGENMALLGSGSAGK